MNLKYYLRGLGIGIVMTAIIMGIASPAKKETLTDKEITEKAKELGMIDDTECAKRAGRSDGRGIPAGRYDG